MMTIISILILWILQGVFVYRSVYLGALYYVILLPLNAPVDVCGSFTVWLSEGLLVSASFVSFYIFLKEKKWSIFRDTTFIFLSLWLISELISITYAPNIPAAVKQVLRWSNLLLWYFVFITGRKDDKTKKIFFHGLGAYTLVLIAIGLFNRYIYRGGPITYMYRSLFADKNIFSTFIAFSAPFVFFEFNDKSLSKINRYIPWLYVVFITVNIILAKSRAACLGWGVFLMYIFLSRKERLKMMIIMSAFVIGILMFVPLSIDIQSFHTKNYRRNSLGVRLGGWGAGLHYIIKSPLWGNGAASFETFAREYDFGEIGTRYYFNDPFNIFIQIGVETGLAGVILFIIAISRIFLKIRSSLSTKDVFLRTGVSISLMFLVNGLFSIIDYAQFIFLSLSLFLLKPNNQETGEG